jgi:hypothetical protein
MRKSFWYHLAAATALVWLMFVLIRLLRPGGAELTLLTPFPGDGVFVGRYWAPLFAPVLLYAVGRLAILSARSDGHASMLSVYSVGLFGPLFFALMESPTVLLSVAFVILAIVQLLISRVAPGRMLNAGLFLGAASLCDVRAFFVFAVLLPVALFFGGRGRHLMRFVLGTLVPLLLLRFVFGRLGLFGNEGWPLPAPSSPDSGSIGENLVVQARVWRFLLDTYFTAAYLPFLLTALVALTMREARLDRPSVLVSLWVGVALVASILAGMIVEEAVSLTYAVLLALAIVIANAGFNVLGTLRAWRGSPRWTLLLIGLFLTPAILGCIRVALRF